MKIICKTSRRCVLAESAFDLDLLVRLRTPAPDAGAGRPPLAIVPTVDVSGSMAGRKLAAVVHALERLLDHLVPGDHIGLCTFDSGVLRAFPVVEISEAKKAELRRVIKGLRAGSNTNLSGGLSEGMAMLAEAQIPDGVRRRVILLTDGLANEGPAVTASDIAGLVSDRAARQVSISAFGYGNDCDQALLGDVAQSGGGSYAHIENDDVVLTAFARELGGLLATYAREVSIRIVPLLGDGAGDGALPVDMTMRDLLFHDDAAMVVQLAVPSHPAQENVPLAQVEVSYLDRSGQRLLTRVTASCDFVTAGREDREDDREIVRLLDERILREAQEAAEARGRAGDFPGARAAIHAAMAKLHDTALLAFAREELLPSYGDQSEYRTRSGIRASSLAALRGTRTVSSVASVSSTFGGAPSQAEQEMEKSFRGTPKPSGGGSDDDEN